MIALRGVTITGPRDPELARLWHLALAKFEAREGHPPETRFDARAVTREYERLASKPHGTMRAVVGLLVQGD